MENRVTSGPVKTYLDWALPNAVNNPVLLNYNVSSHGFITSGKKTADIQEYAETYSCEPTTDLRLLFQKIKR